MHSKETQGSGPTEVVCLFVCQEMCSVPSPDTVKGEKNMAVSK